MLLHKEHNTNGWRSL